MTKKLIIKEIEEFEFPDDLNEFELLSQLELKPKKRETIFFTIDEHHKNCKVDLSYYIQNMGEDLSLRNQNNQSQTKNRYLLHCFLIKDRHLIVYLDFGYKS